MNEKKHWFVCLKWGAFLGGALALFELVKMAARNIEYGNAKVLDIALIIAYILLLYGGIKEFKETYPKRLSFSKAFAGCLFISLVGSAVFFCYSLVHYTFIEKDGLVRKHETALENFRRTLERDTISGNELQAYLDTVAVMMEMQEQQVCDASDASDSLRAEVHKGIALINRYYGEKMTAMRTLDTTDSYRLANFSQHARNVLVETLQSYVSLNQDRPSTESIMEIVQQTNRQLPSVNPAELRYEQRKSRVPEYTRVEVYAAASALMDLLYGMFFGIFVAMFHYKSKATDKLYEPAAADGGNNNEESSTKEN